MSRKPNAPVGSFCSRAVWTTAVSMLTYIQAAAQTAPVDLPDLDVTFIERTPRYIPGPWVYPDQGPQYMGIRKHANSGIDEEHRFTDAELRGEHRQFPSPGEEVTFTAHVANKSARPSPACAFEWHLDGKKVAGGALPPIEPWKETTQPYRWKWDPAAHTIKFVVDPAGAVQEICEKNNAVEDRTDAAALQMRITPQLYQAFHAKPNGMGSYSFEDWTQRHIKIMNGVLAGSKYAVVAPDGILERVRVDEIRLMSKEDLLNEENTPQKFGFDGGWNYYDDNFGKENSWFDFHIQDDFVKKIDTGLLHELTHQLGVIDMYGIAIAPAWNHVRDEDGDPVMVGYHTKNPDMMGGEGLFIDFDGTPKPTLLFTADADGNVTVSTAGTFAAYCEETAGGLNSLKGLRRGHFGLYLFDLPRQNCVQILDNQGQPVAGASVRVHQQNPQPGPQSIPDEPTLQGKTDQNGIFDLGPTPFGNVNCVGGNGSLFFVIQARDHTEYRWLDVCNFNIAKWRGNRDKWTAVLKTAVPPEGAPQPPQHLRWGALEPGEPGVLRWDPPPSKDVAKYRIYRQRTYGQDDRGCGLVVSFESPYVKVADVPATQATCEVKLLPGYAGANETPWFTVTAVDTQGRESGYAQAKELVRWGPFTDAAVKRDDSKSVTLTLHPGPSGLQLRNSFPAAKGTRLSFQISSKSPRPLTLRLAAEGLGPVDLPLATLLPKGTALGDGQWHEVTVDLRDALDKSAAEKKITPAQFRTTWPDAWLVTDCRIGDWSADAKDAATFEFRGVQWTLPR